MRSLRLLSLNIIAGMLVTLLAGCGGSKNSQNSGGLVWPEPPDEPRIQYLKTMKGADDYSSGLAGLTRSIAGGGSSILTSPYDVCTDDSGHIWVTDAIRGVLVFDDNKQEVRVIGEESSIPLTGPRGIAYGNGKIFLGVLGSSQVVVLTPGGKDLYTIGKKGQFPNPVDIFYDSVRHRVVIVDNKLNKVFVYSESGDSILAFGQRGSAEGAFNFPQGVIVNAAGEFLVVDAFNFRVEIFDSTGTYLRKFGEHGDGWGQFGRPKGIALDRSGNIYVCDAYFHNVQIFSPKGELLLFFGKFSSENDGFQDPVNMLIDRQNRLYITDQLNSRIQVFKLLNTETPAE